MKKLLRLAVPLLAATAVPALAMPAGKATVAAAAPDAPVTFEIYLPLRNTAALDKLIADQQTAGSANYHKWLTPAQFAAQFGPTKESLARVKAAVAAGGLKVVRTDAHSIEVSGSAAQTGKLLGTTLQTIKHPGADTQFYASKMTLPASLKAEGAHILSFSGIRPRHPMVTAADVRAIPANRTSDHGSYWYNDLKQAYDYPSYQSRLPNGQRVDGTGVNVAVLMEDQLYPNDVATYFNHENFTANSGGSPIPTVTTVLINGGGKIGGPGTTEASLDVQQVLGGAPGANVTLISIPNLSDKNITDGYNYIVNQNKFDVVNSSFGGCELDYTAAYNGGVDYTYILQAYDDIFKQGNAQGITFVASSGDNGALECTSLPYDSGQANGTFVTGVSFPADSTHVTAVGGGNLQTTYTPGSLNSAYVSENGNGDPLKPYDVYGTGHTASGGYWGAGGGQSVVFPRPDYQTTVNTGWNGRTLPDVGMQVGGCPGGISQTPCPAAGTGIRSSVVTITNGKAGGVIGTSVSSPEFVGALALFIQKQGKRVGNVNTYLYQFGAAQTKVGGLSAPDAAQFYRRNIPGFDGVYHDDFPTKNYNYIYGNGSPDVRKLFGFTNFDAAGVPQTPSNP